MISISIKQIQNNLSLDIHNNLHYYIEVKWKDNMGSIHIITKKHKLLNTVSNLSENYTKYYKKEYKVESIIIKEIINKNPHIKINIDLCEIKELIEWIKKKHSFQITLYLKLNYVYF